MMRDELQAYLDGELPFEDLPADLKPRASAWDEFLEEAREAGSARAPAGLEESVMSRLRGRTPEGKTGWRRAVDWAVRPRTIRVSPLAGGLAAAAMALLLLLPFGLREDTPAVPSPETRIYVQFTLEAPDASSVAVAGDFNEWEAEYVLSDVDGNGTWTGRVPVGPGLHEYMFVVDGSEWTTDPHADRYAEDGFGNRNAVLAVTPPSRT